MKGMKLKMLAAAVALATAGTANAAIDAMTTGDGELFFGIRDNTNQVSYVLDLNVAMSAFNGAGSYSYGADATLSSFLSTGSGDYNWMVLAGDSTGGTTVNGLNFFTTTSDVGNIGANNNAQLGQFGTVETAMVDGASNVLTNTAADSMTAASGTPGYMIVAIDTWNQNSAFNATSSFDGAADSTMSFWHLTNSGSTGSFLTKTKPVDATEFAGSWTLASNGDLTYSSGAPAEVPLPAAVWLLGSALLGMAGVARRKKA